MLVPLATLLSLVCLVYGGVPYGVESLQDLYRLQRLYQMSDLQDPYLPLLPIDSIDGRSDEALADVPPSLWGDDDVYGDGGPFLSGAQARDEEHLEHSALQGLHQVAGGTAEGDPAQKQVKTDKPLPAYCNPPNPCPVGKTAADNCVEEFENSLENNKRLLSRQDCPCDTEHMWSCPAGQQTVTSKGTGGQAALSKVMSQLAQLHSADELSLENNPYLTSGVKREKLVAKKSPELARRKRASEVPDEFNPYLGGFKLPIAAKKSPGTN